MSSKDQPKTEIDWSGFPKSTQEKVGYKQPKQTIDEVYPKSKNQVVDFANDLRREGYVKGYNHAQTEIEGLKRDKAELLKVIKDAYDYFHHERLYGLINPHINSMWELITKHK